MDAVNFKRMCRVCLRESDFVTPMFGTVFKSDIPDKLAYCTGLKIRTGDGKPSLICQVCIDNLHISYTFKKTCLKSDRRFFRHFFGILNDVRVKVERLNVDVKERKVEFEVPFIKEEVGEIVTIKIEDSDDDIDGQDNVDNDFHYDDNLNENVDQESKCDINIDQSLLETLKEAADNNDDEDDDFYWRDDEHLMSVLDSEQDSTNKKPRRKETKPRKKYKQRMNKDGTPKLSKRAQLQQASMKRRPKILPDGCDFVKRKKMWPKVLLNRYCQCCDLRFPSQEERDKHADEVHGGLTTNVICEVCGKMYSLQYIDGHRQAHFPPQYSCKEPGCEFKTTRSSHMTKHMTMHAGADRPKFVCKQCGRAFSWRSSLTSHTRVYHSARRPQLPCSFCGKTFSAKQKLDRHELIHTDEKPYICEYCPSRFNRRDMWKTHLLSSHGVVPPPAKGGPRMHRVVEIDKLKDAGKLVASEKTYDNVDIINDNLDITNDNLDITNENLDITHDKSGFMIANIMQEREVQITIEDADLNYENTVII